MWLAWNEKLLRPAKLVTAKAKLASFAPLASVHELCDVRSVAFNCRSVCRYAYLRAVQWQRLRSVSVRELGTAISGHVAAGGRGILDRHHDHGPLDVLV